MPTLHILKVRSVNGKVNATASGMPPLLLRRLFSGTVLTAESKEEHKVNELFLLPEYDVAYQIVEVEYSGDYFVYELTYAGYFANNPDKESDFMTKILNKKLQKITDSETIKQINIASNYT